MKQPPTRGLTMLAAEARRDWLIFLAGSVVAGASAVALSGRVAAILVGAGGAIAAVFAVAALRASAARRGARSGCRDVVAVGWVRVPDGANYAVFTPEADPATQIPEAVVRLPIRRTMTTAHTVLCGDLNPSLFGGVALFTEGGELLGFGRVRGNRSARKVWNRRNAQTPWWVVGAGMNQPPKY